MPSVSVISLVEEPQQKQEPQRVSTMIPLGAPKATESLQDKYKQMLMAKLDIKTIQKRRSKERI